MGATFVAKCFSGDKEHTAKVIEQVILHKGYALVDIFQPCVSFNKTNTFAWYRDTTYYLENEKMNDSLDTAFQIAQETAPYALGILYQNSGKKTFEENTSFYQASSLPLIECKRDLATVQKLIDQE